MRFTLTLNLDDNATHSAAGVTDVLNRAIDIVNSAYKIGHPSGTSGPVTDNDGNVAGRWAFTDTGMTGLLSSGGWLAGTITAGIVLDTNLYLLHGVLAARRAYDRLGPLAYLAEIRHAFDSAQPAQTPETTAHNLRMLSGTRPRPDSDQSEAFAADPGLQRAFQAGYGLSDQSGNSGHDQETRS